MHQDGGSAEREAGLLASDGEKLLQLVHDVLVVEGQEVGLPLPGDAGPIICSGQQPDEVEFASTPQGQEVVTVKHLYLQ